MHIYFLFFTLLFLSACQNNETIVVDDKLLDNIITMEEQIQSGCKTESIRGSSYMDEIKSEIVSTAPIAEYQGKREKLAALYAMMKSVDEETNQLIKFIEECKMELLKNAGENIKESSSNDPKSIVWRKYQTTNGTELAYLNLWAVNQKNNAKISSDYFISSRETPSSKGLELWNKLNDYRANLIHIIGTYSFSNKEYTIQPKALNDFSDKKKFQQEVRTMLNENGTISMDDEWMLIDLYMSLSFNEMLNYSDGNVHWICDKFNNSPIVNTMATLTSIENTILRARANALTHLKFKVSSGNYSFDEIIAVANGPGASKEGEEIELKVFMAAFDSYNQPTITANIKDAKIEYKEGIGYIKFKPTPGMNKYKGTVSIRSKSGEIKTKEWEYSMNVVSK